MYTPSVSGVHLAQKTVDKWAEVNGMTPTNVSSFIVLQYSVGELNLKAVRACLDFPGSKYVFMPTSDSYWHNKIK